MQAGHDMCRQIDFKAEKSSPQPRLQVFGNSNYYDNKGRKNVFVCMYCIKVVQEKKDCFFFHDDGEWHSVARIARKRYWEIFRNRHADVVAQHDHIFLGWVVCVDCSSSSNFVSGTNCAAALHYGRQGFVCLNGHVPIHHQYQSCMRCKKPCHLQCCSPVNGGCPVGEQTSLFNGYYGIMCLLCKRLQFVENNPYGIAYWRPQVIQATSAPTILLEYPFPMVSLTIYEFPEIARSDKPNSLFWEHVDEFFKAAINHNKQVVKDQQLAADKMKAWKPHTFEQQWSTVPFSSFCGASMGTNEKTEWKKLMPQVLEPVPFMNWFSRITTADLKCLRDESCPRLTLNGIDFLISLLHDAGLEAESNQNKMNQGESNQQQFNFSVTCFPLSFTYALFESFDLFGRRGIARFVASAFHCAGDLFRIKKKKVLLFPFCDFGGNDLYLGVLLLDHAAQGVDGGAKNKFTTLKVVHYGYPDPHFPVTNADVSFVSVLRDFIDMVFINSFGWNEKSVGYTLHTEEAYLPEVSTNQSLSELVLKRKMSVRQGYQTMYLLDDILYFFINEKSLSSTTMAEFSSLCESDDSRPKSESIVDGISSFIDWSVKCSFESLCVKVFPTFDRFIDWIKAGNDGNNGGKPEVRLSTLEPYIRRGKELVKYLYEQDLIQHVDEKCFTRFMQNVTAFALRQTSDSRLTDSRRRENYYLERIKCASCKNWQIPGLHEANYCVSLALPSAQEEYKNRLCIKDDSIVMDLRNMWNAFTGERTLGGDKSFTGVADYLAKSLPDVHYQVFWRLEELMLQEFRWETPTMLELVQLLLHRYHPPPTTAIAFTHEQMLDTFLKEKRFLKIPDHFDRIVCIACRKSHFVVLDVYKLSRQIFVYDGCDDSILDAGPCDDYLERASAGDFESTIGNWLPYCKKLLQLFSLETTPKVGKAKPFTLKVATTMDTAQVRPVRHFFSPSAKDKWLVMPAHLVLGREEAKNLIYQEDDFSCGPIALLHFMKVLGIPMPDGWNAVDPHYASVVMSLPWEEMIGAWLSDCFEPKFVHEEHRERYNIILNENSEPPDDVDNLGGTDNQTGGDTDNQSSTFRPLEDFVDNNRQLEEEGEPNSNRYCNLKQFRHDLRAIESQLRKLRIRPESNPEFWNIKKEFDRQFERVDITKHDANPIIEIPGSLPAFLQPVFVSDFFPAISMVRFVASIDVWEIKLPSFGKETEKWCVKESFLRYIFRDEFINRVVAKGRDVWCHVVYEDYQLDKTALLEKYFREANAVNLDLSLSERQERREVLDLASNYFYTGECAIHLKHVITHRVAAVKDVIITSFTEHHARGLHKVGLRVPFICSQGPHWYVSIWKKGAPVVHRRVPRTHVMRKFPILTIQKAILDPYHWIGVDNEKSQTLVRWNVSNHANLPDSVVDVQNQISHVMFRTFNADVEEILKTKCKLPRRYGTSGRGWYLGSTEKEPDDFELLDYDWVQENMDSRFYKLLLTKRWCDRWITLPAGSSRGKPGPRRKKLKSKKSDTGIADETADPTLVNFFERDYPCLPDAEIRDCWPPVHYRQGSKDQTCLFLSMASALHYLGTVTKQSIFTRIASNIGNFAKRESERNWTSIDRLESLKAIMGGTYVNSKTLKQVDVGCPELLDNIGHFNEKHIFDPLTNQTMLPTLAICESVDGSQDHAVTFVGSWIFDSNEKRALPISRMSLNRCVPFGFQRVVRAFRFGKNVPVLFNLLKKRKGDAANLENSVRATKQQR